MSVLRVKSCLNKLTMYSVDNIFCFLNNASENVKSFEFWNAHHLNVQLTIEITNSYQIQYLLLDSKVILCQMFCDHSRLLTDPVPSSWRLKLHEAISVMRTKPLENKVKHVSTFIIFKAFCRSLLNLSFVSVKYLEVTCHFFLWCFLITFVVNSF